MTRSTTEGRIGWTFIIRDKSESGTKTVFVAGKISEGGEIKSILRRQNPGWDFIDETHPELSQPEIGNDHAD